MENSDWIAIAALAISLLALIAAGVAAWYTRSQAASAELALAHATQPHFQIRVLSRFSLPVEEQGDGKSTDAVWILENNGNGLALNVSVQLEFDPNGITYGKFSFDRIEGNSKVVMQPRASALPQITELFIRDKQRVQTAEITWKAPDGNRRSRTIPIGI